MKRIYFVAVLLLVTSLAFAQRPEGGQGNRNLSVGERAKLETEWMKTELKLTAKQIAPVDSINLIYAKDWAALREAANGDREKMREAMTNLLAKREKALTPVLTKEQMVLYKKRMSERPNFQRRNN